MHGICPPTSTPAPLLLCPFSSRPSSGQPTAGCQEGTAGRDHPRCDMALLWVRAALLLASSPAGQYQRHTRVSPRPVLQTWLVTSPPQRLRIAKTGLSLTEGLPAPRSSPPARAFLTSCASREGSGWDMREPAVAPDFPDRRDALHAGALTSGDIGGQMSSRARGLSRTWRVSRWVLGTAGSSAAQVLREGSSEGMEAVVFLRCPGPSLGRLRVDGTGHVSEHQPAGPLQRALRGDSGLAL